MTMKRLECPWCKQEYADDRDLETYTCEECGYYGPMEEKRG